MGTKMLTRLAQPKRKLLSLRHLEQERGLCIHAGKKIMIEGGVNSSRDFFLLNSNDLTL